MRHKSASLGVDLKKQRTLLEFNTSRRKLTQATYVSKNKSLALFCALDLRPVSLVQGHGFRQFMRKVNPEYKVPCNKTIIKYLNILYSEVKAELIDSISGHTAAFTTDMWTSVANRGFITVTAHFINDDWELLAKSIATRAVDERHTGENLAQVILSLKEEFSIGMLKALVTDNAGNMKCAAKEANIERIACFAHSLQLAIGDGMNKVAAVTKAIGFGRKLVTHFNHSSVSVKALMDHQIKMGVERPLKVIQDVATRWNSQFLMIKRLLLLRVSIYGVLLDETVTAPSDRNDLALPESAWKIMEDIVPVLSPLAEATELLSVEDLPTASQIYVLLFHLVTSLKPADTDTGAVKELRAKITAGLKKRFNIDSDNGPTKEALLTSPMVATLLDPRYKSLKFLSAPKKQQLIEYVQEVMASRELTGCNPPASEAASIKSEDQPGSLIMDWLSGDIVDLTDITSTTSTEELQRYIDEPVREPNPLKWWKQNDNKLVLYFIHH